LSILRKKKNKKKKKIKKKDSVFVLPSSGIIVKMSKVALAIARSPPAFEGATPVTEAAARSPRGI
jgi:hypothetical protein